MPGFRPWQPTIDHRHPANRGLAFSFGTLRTGSQDNFRRVGGTVNGSPALVSDAYIGAAVRFRSALDDYYTYANRPTFNTPMTLAAIVNFSTINAASGQCILANSSGASGVQLVCLSGTSTVAMSARSVANYNPALTLATGIPYLLVGSIAWDLTVYMMAVRLDNGVILHDWSGNAGTPGTPDGNYRLASNDLANRSCGADFSAALISNTFMNRDALLQWADDPWGPWRVAPFHPEIISIGTAAAGVANLQASVSMCA